MQPEQERARRLLITRRFTNADTGRRTAVVVDPQIPGEHVHIVTRPHRKAGETHRTATEIKRAAALIFLRMEERRAQPETGDPFDNL